MLMRSIVVVISILVVSGVAAGPAVAVDATLVADTYTSALAPSTNFGSATTLRVQGPASAQQAYLRFDLGTLPVQATGNDVAHATLQLWVNQVATRGTIVAREVLARWGERGLTHATAPALGNVVATAPVATARSFVTLDVTALVRDWLNGTLANAGVAIVPDAAGAVATFDSKENETTSHEPRLEIVLSGVSGMTGDITRINPGTGLAGGGTSGTVWLSVAPAYRLPQACPTGQVPHATASGTWGCGADADSGGDLTSVTAGTGLAGGGTSGDVTLDIATGYRLPQGCGPNQVAKGNGLGGWVCANDVDSGGDVTSVTAGLGLSGGGASGDVSIAVASSYRLPQSCTLNQVPKSNGAGGWTCSAGVSTVTAGAPLSVTAGSAPNITLPHVTISGTTTVLGTNALSSNPTGAANTALGGGALQATTLGENNTAAGAEAMIGNTEGTDNTAVGMRALRFNTTGVNNTAVGVTALTANTLGTDNTAVGLGALGANTTGVGNIAVGVGAGGAQTAGSNNVYIGADGVNLESNTVYLGNTSHTRAFVGGIYGVTTGSDDGIAVVVDSNGQLGTVSSTRRVKEAIADMGALSRRLLELRPVTFRYVERSNKTQFGLIAEEVAAVFPELVAYGKDGQPLTVLYHVLPALLLNELQRQEREIAELRAVVDALRTRTGPAPGVR